MRAGRLLTAGCAVFLTLSIGVGCKKDSRPPASCNEGFEQHPEEPAVCRMVQPAEACPPNTKIRVGEEICASVGNHQCGEDFRPGVDGWGCEPILPVDACPTGSLAVVGEESCQPTGVPACPLPLLRDSSGWGCEDPPGPLNCEWHERRTIGGACAPIGDCSRPFPPADATLFVDSSFSSTQLDATHYRILGEAVAASVPNDVIAVVAGVYWEDGLAISHRLSIIGQCAAEVHLMRPSGGNAPAFEVTSGWTQISGMSIVDYPTAVLANGGGVGVEEARLDGNWNIAVQAFGPLSVVIVRNSAIRFTRPGTGVSSGIGVVARGGASLTLEDVELRANMGTAISVTGAGSSLSANRMVVHQTESNTAGNRGLGLEVLQGASGSVIQSVFARNRGAEVVVGLGGAQLSLVDSVLRDTQLEANGQVATGIEVANGGALTMSACTVLRTTSAGLLVQGSGTTAQVTDSAFVRTPAEAGHVTDVALSTHNRARSELRRVAVVEATNVGLLVGGPGSQTVMDDVLVSGTRPGLSGNNGLGLAAVDRGRAIVTRAHLTNNQMQTVHASNQGSVVELYQTLIEGTRPGASDPELPAYWPVGAEARNGGAIVCEGCAVRNNGHAAFKVGSDDPAEPGGVLQFRGGWIGPQDTDSTRDWSGAGIRVGTGSRATVETSTIWNTSSTALLASGEGASIEVSETTVDGVLRGSGDQANALVAEQGATLAAESVAILGPEGRGIFAYGEGSAVALRDSLVRGAGPGLAGEGMLIQEGASGDVIGCEISGAGGLGVGAIHRGSSLYLDKTLVRGTSANSLGVGYGVGIWAGASSSLLRSSILNNDGVGVAIISAASRMTWLDVRDNPVGLHPTGGTQIEEVEAMPTVAEPNTAHVTRSCFFDFNETPTGSGTLLVPEAAAGPVGF